MLTRKLGLVSTSASYQFTVDANRSLIAHFIPAVEPIAPLLSLQVSSPHGLAILWPTNAAGFVLQMNANLTTTNWLSVTNAVTQVATNNQVIIPSPGSSGFFRLVHF